MPGYLGSHCERKYGIIRWGGGARDGRRKAGGYEGQEGYRKRDNRGRETGFPSNRTKIINVLYLPSASGYSRLLVGPSTQILETNILK